MYKNIIPDLVSFDTSITTFRGSYFFRHLDFYPTVRKRYKYHYKIKLENFVTPKSYNFRNGYFFKFRNVWFYERTILKFFKLKLKYDITNRTITFNKLFTFIPFEIGSIVPTGKLIADIINLDLFLDGNILIGGCAFEYDNVCTCIIAPSFNGKTTLINKLIEKGCLYIAEDVLVISFEENKVYPTSIIRGNFGRAVNSKLADKLNKNIVAHKRDINDILFLLNFTSATSLVTNCSMMDFIMTNSISFLGNRFIRSIIFVEGETHLFFDQLFKLKNMDIKFKILSTDNFNFKSIYEQITA